jgi:hypothetical protein
VIATKALACKLAKAAWYLMVEGTAYEPARMFGQPAATSMKTGLWECGRQLVEGVGAALDLADVNGMQFRLLWLRPAFLRKVRMLAPSSFRTLPIPDTRQYATKNHRPTP